MKPAIPLLLLALLLAGCKEPLYTRLIEQEANEIVGTLIDNDIDASKGAGEEGQWTVSIARSDFSQAVSVLREGNFPREPTSGLGEVFRKEGLVSSPTEERARLIHALSQELSRTLSKIDGVLLARVHVVIATPDPITDRRAPSSASVFIKHRNDVDMNRFVPQIKAMVMNAIEGTTYDSVSVALFPSDRAIATPARAKAVPDPRKNLWLGAAALTACALAWAAYAAWRRVVSQREPS